MTVISKVSKCSLLFTAFFPIARVSTRGAAGRFKGPEFDKRGPPPTFVVGLASSTGDLLITGSPSLTSEPPLPKIKVLFSLTGREVITY